MAGIFHQWVDFGTGAGLHAAFVEEKEKINGRKKIIGVQLSLGLCRAPGGVCDGSISAVHLSNGWRRYLLRQSVRRLWLLLLDGGMQ